MLPAACHRLPATSCLHHAPAGAINYLYDTDPDVRVHMKVIPGRVFNSYAAHRVSVPSFLTCHTHVAHAML